MPYDTVTVYCRKSEYREDFDLARVVSEEEQIDLFGGNMASKEGAE